MTYAELVAAITSYTENQFSTTDINTFITQAEQRVLNTVQLPAARKNTTLQASVNTPFLTLPADFLYIFSLGVVAPDGSIAYLLNKDVNFIREAFPFPAVVGQPTHYSLYNATELFVGPTPNIAYTFTLSYSGYPLSITVAGNTWLGDNFSSVLLYGALVEATVFMKGEADVSAMYDAKFKEALALLKQLSDAKNRQDVFRDGQIRYPVT